MQSERSQAFPKSCYSDRESDGWRSTSDELGNDHNVIWPDTPFFFQSILEINALLNRATKPGGAMATIDELKVARVELRIAERTGEPEIIQCARARVDAELERKAGVARVAADSRRDASRR